MNEERQEMILSDFSDWLRYQVSEGFYLDGDIFDQSHFCIEDYMIHLKNCNWSDESILEEINNFLLRRKHDAIRIIAKELQSNCDYFQDKYNSLKSLLNTLKNYL